MYTEQQKEPVSALISGEQTLDWAYKSFGAAVTWEQLPMAHIGFTGEPK